MDPASTSSRFVSESSLKEAQERRQEEWTKAYERMGQAPPPVAAAEKYDPRSLYERLQEQKDTKQAAFDEKYSIRNQWQHGLEDDEAKFISDVMREKMTAEQERQAEIDAELLQFRNAVNARQTLPDPPPGGSAASPPLPSTSTSPPALASTANTAPAPAKAAIPPPKKKAGLQQKGLLAGAIKRKSSGEDAKSGPKKKLATAEAKNGDKGQTAQAAAVPAVSANGDSSATSTTKTDKQSITEKDTEPSRQGKE